MFMYQERGKGNEERILEKGQEQQEKLFGFKSNELGHSYLVHPEPSYERRRNDCVRNSTKRNERC